MSLQDPAARLAAIDASRAAVGEAVAHLDRALWSAAELDRDAAWVSPAATAFREALRRWRDEVSARRHALHGLDDELCRERARLSAAIGSFAGATA